MEIRATKAGPDLTPPRRTKHFSDLRGCISLLLPGALIFKGLAYAYLYTEQTQVKNASLVYLGNIYITPGRAQ